MAVACAVGVAFSSVQPAEPAAAGEPDASVVQEILQVLDARGLLEEGQYEQLSARYTASEKEREDWTSRLSFSGDLRTRYEAFWYQNDPTDSDLDNRFRGRYRLRLAADAEVNDYIDARLRLASGEDDSRSTNTSFGRPGPDFDPDYVFIDRAYLALQAPERWLPLEQATAGLDIGKVPNPFVWKSTRDWMLWDNDINPEGVALHVRGEAATGLEVFANGGYFIIQENAQASDPHMIGAQLGAEWEDGDFAAGGRASWYGFRSLDGDFICRGVRGRDLDSNGNCTNMGDRGATPAAGNLFDGLTSGGERIDVADFTAYVAYDGLGSWPIRLFGQFSNNFSARSVRVAPNHADREGQAWGVGLEVGDKKELVLIGAGYWHIEANAFPSQFIDSDLFDGVTNRKGPAFWSSRRILPNTDLNLTVFVSDAIDDGLTDFSLSVAGSERVRLQSDLVVEF